MAADARVTEINFEKRVFGKLHARMETGDKQQHIRVIGHGGIEVLDADRLGDWSIEFHIGSFFNHTSSGCHFNST